MKSGVMPVDVDVDIEGVNKLKIEFKGGGNNVDYGIYNAGLY